MQTEDLFWISRIHRDAASELSDPNKDISEFIDELKHHIRSELGLDDDM